MSNARPIRERELLIDDEVRTGFRRTIDPQIDDALLSRGYTEERQSGGRIYLDGTNILPSVPFRTLYETPFDGLSIATAYEVYENVRTLTKSTLELSRIGGFSASRLVSVGSRYYTKNFTANQNANTVPYTRISQQQVQDILQDIRAHTELGYSSSDTNVPPEEVIEELQTLHPTLSIDQRAHYQLLTSPEHGDIQMNIGKSLELREVKVGKRIQRRPFNVKRLFEIIATQPVDEGATTVGIHYRSSRYNSELKITAEIDSAIYTEEEKQHMYDEVVRSYQEHDVHKFGRGALANLAKITNTSPTSDIIRLG
jgi:hypothetical protein